MFLETMSLGLNNLQNDTDTGHKKDKQPAVCILLGTVNVFDFHATIIPTMYFLTSHFWTAYVGVHCTTMQTGYKE